ncbi:MAG: GNAT family N-acetyltransferase [Propionibacterium sp.]|nr:GNAT family N-acetyltransferase [Propionibacterium sp.]
MSQTPEHVHLARPTERMPAPAATGPLCVFASLPSPEELAPLMLDSYRGTPDDEGETLEETVEVVRSAMEGVFGVWMPEASFVALGEDGRAWGAVITAREEDGVPFIAFLFVHPDQCGRGVASGLVAHTCRVLADCGHPTVRLWVSGANGRAVRLYRHLGFVEVTDTPQEPDLT